VIEREDAIDTCVEQAVKKRIRWLGVFGHLSFSFVDSEAVIREASHLNGVCFDARSACQHAEKSCVGLTGMRVCTADFIPTEIKVKRAEHFYSVLICRGLPSGRHSFENRTHERRPRRDGPTD
jgi:hypothetical protein